MKTRFFETGLVMAAVCCLLSCYGGQDNGLNGVRFENYASMKEVVEGKALDRSKFVLPSGPESFGKKLYSEKTICFDDAEDHDGVYAKTCIATVYERGICIEVDGHKSYFDAEGLEMMPTEGEITVTGMPSSIPGAPWQPAIVVLDENSFWIYTSLYNKGDFGHRDQQEIKGWYWTYAKQQGYQYKVLVLK